MMNKPRDPASGKQPPSGQAPAVDDARAQRERDAEEAHRKAEAQAAPATDDGGKAPSSLKGRIKRQGDKDNDPIQDSSDESVVEDEP